VRKILSNATPPLHQLHLFLIGFDDATVGIRIIANHKTVAQRRNLHGIANTCHRTTLRHHIAKIAQQFIQLLLCDRIRVAELNARQLTGNASVHIVRRQLVYIAQRILERILVDPYVGSQFITFKIGNGGLENFLIGIGGQSRISLSLDRWWIHKLSSVMKKYGFENYLTLSGGNLFVL